MLLSLKQASNKFKIPIPVMRKYIRESGIEIREWGGAFRVELKDLEKVIKDRRVQAKRNAKKCSESKKNKAPMDFFERLRQE